MAMTTWQGHNSNDTMAMAAWQWTHDNGHIRMAIPQLPECNGNMAIATLQSQHGNGNTVRATWPWRHGNGKYIAMFPLPCCHCHMPMSYANVMLPLQCWHFDVAILPYCPRQLHHGNCIIAITTYGNGAMAMLPMSCYHYHVDIVILPLPCYHCQAAIAILPVPITMIRLMAMAPWQRQCQLLWQQESQW